MDNLNILEMLGADVCFDIFIRLPASDIKVIAKLHPQFRRVINSRVELRCQSYDTVSDIVRANDIDVLRMIKPSSIKSAEMSAAIRTAFECDRLTCVEYLMETLGVECDTAVFRALKADSVKCLKYLYEKCGKSLDAIECIPGDCIKCLIYLRSIGRDLAYFENDWNMWLTRPKCFRYLLHLGCPVTRKLVQMAIHMSVKYDIHECMDVLVNNGYH
jgi:hypothetical protein